jgi:transketolase
MRAFEFIRTDVGIGSLPVKLVGGVPGFLSDANGPTHQAIEDVALMRGIPGMQVFCPADEEDMVLGLKTVLREPWPVYIRHNPIPAVYKHDQDFKIGKAEQVTNGTDLTILVYGMLFNQAYEATDILEWQGVSVRLINLRTLKPIDEELITKAIQETKLIVTLEDHFITGGLYSIVSEIIARGGTTANILPLGLANRWFKPSTLPKVLASEGFTGQQISNRITRHMH